jgi:hypothetical protein
VFPRRDLRQRADYFANPSLNRTRNGMSPSSLASFCPCCVLPLRAG